MNALAAGSGHSLQPPARPSQARSRMPRAPVSQQHPYITRLCEHGRRNGETLGVWEWDACVHRQRRDGAPTGSHCSCNCAAVCPLRIGLSWRLQHSACVGSGRDPNPAPWADFPPPRTPPRRDKKNVPVWVGGGRQGAPTLLPGPIPRPLGGTKKRPCFKPGLGQGGGGIFLYKTF